MSRAVIAFVLAAGIPVAALASETITYTYDALGRLIKVASSGTSTNSVKNGQTQTICYDKAGNRFKFRSDATGATAGCETANN
jgi:hypothetical protein